MADSDDVYDDVFKVYFDPCLNLHSGSIRNVNLSYIRILCV